MFDRDVHHTPRLCLSSPTAPHGCFTSQATYCLASARLVPSSCFAQVGTLPLIGPVKNIRQAERAASHLLRRGLRCALRAKVSSRLASASFVAHLVHAIGEFVASLAFVNSQASGTPISTSRLSSRSSSRNLCTIGLCKLGRISRSSVSHHVSFLGRISSVLLLHKAKSCRGLAGVPGNLSKGDGTLRPKNALALRLR